MLGEVERKAFEQVTQHVLKTWTILSLAVENFWGGKNSKLLRQVLFDSILEIFYGKKIKNVDDLANFLFEFFRKEFNIVIEDNSDEEVASILIELYSELSSSNFELAKKLIEVKPANLQKCMEKSLFETDADLENLTTDSEMSSKFDEESNDL